MGCMKERGKEGRSSSYLIGSLEIKQKKERNNWTFPRGTLERFRCKVPTECRPLHHHQRDSQLKVLQLKFQTTKSEDKILKSVQRENIPLPLHMGGFTKRARSDVLRLLKLLERVPGLAGCQKAATLQRPKRQSGPRCVSPPRTMNKESAFRKIPDSHHLTATL